MSEVSLGHLHPKSKKQEPPKPKVREAVEPGLYLVHATGRYEHGWRDPVSKKFQLRTLYNDPITKRDPCSNITQARRAKKQLISQVEQRLVVGSNKTTLDQQAERWFKAQHARIGKEEGLQEGSYESWKTRYRLHIQPTLGHLRVQDVTHVLIGDLYTEWLEGGKSLSLRKDSHQVLKRILKSAVSDGVIASSPMVRVEEEKIPKGKKRHDFRVLTHAECQKLIAEAEEEFRMVITILAYTGLRVGEALELRWRDIDFVTPDEETPPVIRPRRQLTRNTIKNRTKTLAGSSRKREVPVLPFLREELLLHLANEVGAGRGGSDDLVVSRDGEALDWRLILREVKRAVLAIGVTEYFTTHTLRHTFLSNCASSGMDVVHVSQIAGHSSPSVTLDIYSHFFDEGQALKKAQERLLRIGFGAAAESKGV